MFSLLFRRRLDFGEDRGQRRDITPLELEMYKRALRRELQDKRKHAATCATLVCILVCGSILVGLGTALTCSGIFVPHLKGNPMPWLVTGPTCIVIGILVLLLSVEIIIKKKKVAIDDLSSGRKKVLSSDPQVKQVKALPIWRGMDKAKSTGNQGTLPPLTEDALERSLTVVAECQGPSTSSYASTSTASSISSSPLTPLETGRSQSMMLLDPAKLDRKFSRSSEVDVHTSTSELVSTASTSSTSCETRESTL